MSRTDYEPDRVTVGNLFKDDNQLVIPRFQRSYEWKDANIDEFYNDFIRTSDASLNFLGNIVIDASREGEYQVIDGQQRLITLTILCAVIRDLLKEELRTASAYDLASRIDSTYLKSGVSFTSNTATYKLTPSKELEEFFYSYIQHGGETARKQLPKLASHKNVVNAYKKFRQLIMAEKLSGGQDPETQVKFLEQVMERLHKITLITIAVYDQDAAYAIFESFNAKRVDLSVADLVKNYYFSMLKGDEDSIRRNMDRWDKVVTRITAIPGGRVDRFLYYYLQAREGKFTKSQLYRHVRADIVKSPEKFIKNLERATDEYSQLKDANIQSSDDYFISYETQNTINAALDGINRFNVEQCFILLMALMLNKQKFTPAFIGKIVRLLENFTFVFSKIANGQANVLERIYSDFSKDISESESPKDIQIYSGQIFSRLQKALQEVLPKYESFEAEFTELDYSNPQHKRLIGYMFERIEIVNTRGGSALGDLANIDHIFPQNPNGVKRPTRYQKIGNLLPIDRATNSKVGNKLPAEKILIYEDIKNITQVQEFLAFARDNGTEMTNEVIDRRSAQMARNAYNTVWSIEKL